MMGKLGSYIISVTAAAIALGILSSIGNGKGGENALLRLVGGIFMLIVVIQPAVNFRFDGLESFVNQTLLDAELAAQEGEEMASDAMCDIIKAETESYILDKACSYDVVLDVDVSVGEDGIHIPDSVTILGSCPASIQELLSEVISTDLGIPKERQRWIGSN